MGLLERGRRRTLRELGPGEVVLASLSGVEADGRRRRFVLLTDRRGLIGSGRGEAPVELDLDHLEADVERPGGLLTLRSGTTEVVLRDVDEMAARALVAVVVHHRRSTWAEVAPPPGVRVVPEVADDAG